MNYVHFLKDSGKTMYFTFQCAEIKDSNWARHQCLMLITLFY
jgi:hypothetical protein